MAMTKEEAHQLLRDAGVVTYSHDIAESATQDYGDMNAAIRAAVDLAVRPFTATRAPALRKASMAPRPIPRVPPVTSTRLSVKSISITALLTTECGESP